MVATKATRDNMIKESGVELSVTDDDIEEYLDEVIKEVEESRLKSG